MSEENRSWRDRIVRERMEVDQQFAERIRQSEFSSQEWNLIMTAVEFEIRGGGNDATLIADTDRISSVMPELERIRSQGPAATAGSESSGGGLFDSIRSTLGFGSGVDRKQREAAVDLADAYAAALQSHLEDSGKWDRISEAAGRSSTE